MLTGASVPYRRRKIFCARLWNGTPSSNSDSIHDYGHNESATFCLQDVQSQFFSGIAPFASLLIRRRFDHVVYKNIISRMRNTVVLAILCTTMISALAEVVTLSFQVEPQREECFFEDIEMGKEVYATVLVFRGGKLDVKLRVESPNAVVLYDQLVFSNVDDATGRLLGTIIKKGHTFVAPSAGTYKFCVDNKMARWTAKVVSLELEWREKGSEPKFIQSGVENTAENAVNIMKDNANRIHAKMLMIENSQRYHYHREVRHLETQQSTNGRVMYWTFVESGIVLFITACQIFLVTHWFNKQQGRQLPGARLQV